ncbi:hypothetical protein D3C87_1818510 [compost metagenome]
MRGRDVVVLEALRLAPCEVEGGLERARDVDRAPRPLDRGQLGEIPLQLLGEGLRRDLELAQQGIDGAFGLLDQGQEQVLGLHLLVVARLGGTLGLLQRLLGFDGEAVETHRSLLSRGRVWLGGQPRYAKVI